MSTNTESKYVPAKFMPRVVAGTFGLMLAFGALGATPAAASSSIGCQSMPNPPMNCDYQDVDPDAAADGLKCLGAAGVGAGVQKTFYAGPKAAVAGATGGFAACTYYNAVN